MDAHDTEFEETRPDLLIVTDDGQRLKCFSDILVRNSEQLKVAIAMARRQVEEQKEEQADAERAAKRAKPDPVPDDEKDLVVVKLPEDSGKAWKNLWDQYDDRQAAPAITWGTVKDMLKLAHKYGLQRPLQACLKFVNENMMDLNMTDNESACIIKWLVIAKQREQPELYKVLKDRLREYVNVINTCCYAEDGSASRHNWPKEKCGPCDLTKIQQQATVTIDKVSEGKGLGDLMKQLDEEVKYVMMRMQAKVLGKVMSKCMSAMAQLADLQRKVKLAHCADCPKSLCHNSKSYCSKCVHKKLYAKKDKGGNSGGGGLAGGVTKAKKKNKKAKAGQK